MCSVLAIQRVKHIWRCGGDCGEDAPVPRLHSQDLLRQVGEAPFDLEPGQNEQGLKGTCACTVHVHSHLHTCVVLFPPAHLRCALPTCTLALCSSHLHTCIVLFPPAHLHCALPTCTLALRSSHLHTCVVLFPPAHLHCALCMCVSCSHCFAVWRITTYCTSVPPHRLD